MKRHLFLGLLIVVLSCKKDNSISIPIHQGSLAWFVNTSDYFINGSIDTMRITSADTFSQWASYLYDLIPNSGFWDTEARYQSITIDTAITYQTIISSNLDSGYVRADKLSLLFVYGETQISFIGEAYPANQITLDSGTFYLPVWEANGEVYDDVFYKEVIGTDHVVVFVNRDYNLVGYFINGELYNLRK